MILIFHIGIFITLSLIIIVYCRFFRFTKKSVINKIIRNHLKYLKNSLINNDNTHTSKIEYCLGNTNKIDDNVFIKLKEILANKGFDVKIVHDKNEYSYLTIK